MSVTRKHMYRLNLISRNLELKHFLGTFLTFLNQPVPGNNNEKLPLGMMSMLPLRDSRLGNIHFKRKSHFRFR